MAWFVLKKSRYTKDNLTKHCIFFRETIYLIKHLLLKSSDPQLCSLYHPGKGIILTPIILLFPFSLYFFAYCHVWLSFCLCLISHNIWCNTKCSNFNQQSLWFLHIDKENMVCFKSDYKVLNKIIEIKQTFQCLHCTKN